MDDSPYRQHREMLLTGRSPTECCLQEFAISMFASYRFKFSSGCLRAFTVEQLGVFGEMAASFQRHGHNDPDFVDVCQIIIAKRTKAAQDNLALLISYQTLQKSGLPLNEYLVLLKTYQMQHRVNREKGYIDTDNLTHPSIDPEADLGSWYFEIL
ncbi:hypothetical protein [Pseudomonas sp. GM30]|uniref:hypothetical protein n=1 Tax=Pseudomonas sp. GM30 TaxID=1144328 RepID=UPI0002700BAA|nr:hypothetical protein [Pseudomonas sp. GM30]EUB87003.1 hypothetical protein PMI25_004497 [Pseudomonas sp. GM30]